jgi:hypothetical protein
MLFRHPAADACVLSASRHHIRSFLAVHPSTTGTTHALCPPAGPQLQVHVLTASARAYYQLEAKQLRSAAATADVSASAEAGGQVVRLVPLATHYRWACLFGFAPEAVVDRWALFSHVLVATPPVLLVYLGLLSGWS